MFPLFHEDKNPHQLSPDYYKIYSLARKVIDTLMQEFKNDHSYASVFLHDRIETYRFQFKPEAKQSSLDGYDVSASSDLMFGIDEDLVLDAEQKGLIKFLLTFSVDKALDKDKITAEFIGKLSISLINSLKSYPIKVKNITYDVAEVVRDIKKGFNFIVFEIEIDVSKNNKIEP